MVSVYRYFGLGELEEKIKELSSQKNKYAFASNKAHISYVRIFIFQLLLYIDPKIVKSHGTLKLCERMYGIITQHVTFEMIKKANGTSVENVLNKVSLKQDVDLMAEFEESLPDPDTLMED